MSDHYAEEKAVSSGHEASFESHHPAEMTAGQYARTRFSTLKPPMHKAPNPIRLLRMLSGKQWLFFLVGFLAWVSSHTTPSSIRELNITSLGTPLISSQSA
jgi:SHS family lactate transporter-like MFS transporter